MVAISVNRVTKTFKRYEKQERILDNFFHRKYLEKVAVDNVSFQINKGECVAVIGQNGAGKTTMMKLMSGLLLPTTGKIEVLNYNPFKKEKAYKKSITLLLGQKQQLWWDVSAKDNYLLLKDIYELRDKEYEKNLSELVEMIGAEDILQSPVRTLSLGERMKMELIASLIHKPDIVFLDEPTIGLDVITQYNIRNFLKEYCVKYGSTILLTSHNFNDIVTLCDSIILINNGEMIYSDTFKNFQKQFFNQKYFVLKLKEPNVDEFISKLHLENDIEIEKIDSNSIKIATDNNKSLDILKNISGNFIQELSDINIENISMDDVIRKIYQK